MNRDDLRAQWAQLRAQWEESTLLRLGGLAVAALLAVYLLLSGFDAADAQRERGRQLAAELKRLQALSREGDWPQREQELAGLKAAYDAGVWSDPDTALTEARFQDWLRNATQRLGLKVREIALVRVEPGAKASEVLPAGYVVVRARLVLEVQRTPLFTLLAEMARQEQRIIVERLVLRGVVAPAVAEMDLRILARAGAQP
jgi:hypothetical protein